MSKYNDNETYELFRDLVNMSSEELDEWLATQESKSVGWTHDGEDESVGHKSGRRIKSIEQKDRAALDPQDLDHMRKVVGYIKRHLAQRPQGDVEHSRWRYSLMNWGHDPLKAQR